MLLLATPWAPRASAVYIRLAAVGDTIAAGCSSAFANSKHLRAHATCAVARHRADSASGAGGTSRPSAVHVGLVAVANTVVADGGGAGVVGGAHERVAVEVEVALRAGLWRWRGGAAHRVGWHTGGSTATGRWLTVAREAVSSCRAVISQVAAWAPGSSTVDIAFILVVNAIIARGLIARGPARHSLDAVE